MTKSQALVLTIEACDARFETELVISEITMRDLGASDAEIAAAIGPDGYTRRALKANRDLQVAEATRWLLHGGKLH